VLPLWVKAKRVGRKTEYFRLFSFDQLLRPKDVDAAVILAVVCGVVIGQVVSHIASTRPSDKSNRDDRNQFVSLVVFRNKNNFAVKDFKSVLPK
jgi:hypothetical protein